MPSRRDTILRKRELEEAVRRSCTSGELTPGDMVPPVRDLAARHGLSLSVVNQELQKLVEAGVLYTIPRVGTFVSPTAAHASASPSMERGFLEDTIVLLRISSDSGHDNSHTGTGFVNAVNTGAVHAIHDAGMHLLTLHSDRLLNEATGVGEIEQIVAQKPYGIIFSDLKSPDDEVMEIAATFRKHGVPIAVYGDFAGYDRVVPHHESGSYQLTSWLIERGHRRIVMSWELPLDHYWAAARRAGYERAMHDAGLEPLPVLPLPYFSEWQHNYALEEQARGYCGNLVEALRGPEPPDALMAVSDGGFFALAAACKLLGIEPNRDISIVGFDNFWRDSDHLARVKCAPLATVEKFNGEAGRELVQLLRQRVRGELPAEPQRRLIEPKLVVVAQEEVLPVTTVRSSMLAESSRATPQYIF